MYDSKAKEDTAAKRPQQVPLLDSRSLGLKRQTSSNLSAPTSTSINALKPQTKQSLSRSVSNAAAASASPSIGDPQAAKFKAQNRPRKITLILSGVLITIACFQVYLFEQHAFSPTFSWTTVQPTAQQAQQQALHWLDPSEWKVTLDKTQLPKLRSAVSPRVVVVDAADQLNSSSLFRDTYNKTIVANDIIGAASSTPNPIHVLLQSAGVTDLSEDERSSLPVLWKSMNELYGPMSDPVIIGLETCERYRQTVPKRKRYAAVAGLFNTGTNAMEHHLRTNLKLPSAWQVPWGKHRMEYVRLNHTAPGMDWRVKEHCLPIVVIRDPYHWMHSMCKEPYATMWPHSKHHCPNLVPNEHDYREDEFLRNASEVRVKVRFDKKQTFYWKSLLHLWQNWYHYYLREAAYPRLIIRFEDMLLHGPAIIQKIADCTESTVAEDFHFQTSSSKSHGSGTTFLKAITKTGNARSRVEGMTAEDLQYAKVQSDSELMQVFQYRHPDISTLLR